MSLSAKVKNVLSGDTLVLVPPKSTKVPPPERLLTLQYVRADSYVAKEYLRSLAVGKEVKFTVLYTMAASGKEFGDVSSPVFASLIEHMVEKGLARVKDNAVADSDKDAAFLDGLRAAERDAQKRAAGVWAPAFAEPETVPWTAALAAAARTTPVEAVVERVVSGDRVVLRVLVDAAHHASQPVLLAGVRAPRTDDPDPAAAKTGLRAKMCVEDVLLMNRAHVAVTVVGENSSGVPLVLLQHPAGSIQETLLRNGLVEIADWQSTMVGSQLMARYRQAAQAKKTSPAAAAAAPASAAAFSASSMRPGASADVVVSKIISADTYNVRLPAGDEITVQLASVRAPRPNDPTAANPQHQQALVQMAREHARVLAIGKTASMFVDGHRAANKDLNLESRFLVSLRIAAKDLSESLVASGLATVIKHNKQTTHERSQNWDRLVEVEAEQKQRAQNGVFASGDVSRLLTVAPRVVNASENVAKARTFFNGLHKKGRIGGYHVEFVSSANRVKLYNAKEGLKLTLVLGGLSRPDTDEGLDYLNRKLLQRNVEFEVYDQDKVGGFIGNLYAGAQARKPVQLDLVASGLCAVHPAAVMSNPYEKDLVAAEESAKSAKAGLWKNYDAGAAQKEADAAAAQMSALGIDATKPRFFDIEVVDISASGVISFHHSDAVTSAEFARFKQEFNDFHAQQASASAASVDRPTALVKGPKKNDYVSAKFAENGKYYRAKVVSFDRAGNTYEVKHIDFGNIDKAPLSSLRTLPKRFAVETIKPFAHTCRLQNVDLPPNKPRDYLSEAMYVLEDLAFDRKLVLSGLPSAAAGVEYNAVLYDAEESLKDASYTINKQLVAEGFGIVDDVCPPHLKEYVSELKTVEAEAKRGRLGCWEMGDIREESAL